MISATHFTSFIYNNLVKHSETLMAFYVSLSLDGKKNNWNSKKEICINEAACSLHNALAVWYPILISDSDSDSLYLDQLNKEGPPPHQIKYYDCAVETAVEDWWKEVEVKKRIILFIVKEGGEEPWMAMENNKQLRDETAGWNDVSERFSFIFVYLDTSSILQPFDAGNYDLFYNTHQTGMLRMLEGRVMEEVPRSKSFTPLGGHKGTNFSSSRLTKRACGDVGLVSSSISRARAYS
ncbi:hypothetical protein M8C21_021239 [Ambrosia artemisiifolia]|uniref:Uncharacterized protein n=1 Tax=Ambrosia artemisiifolia TaxID=4212 RepID=A0AAD5GR45_AMBAR|nr:hypothetical protein M8C21_021239 [Ambrosia artemisiifolia]